VGEFGDKQGDTSPCTDRQQLAHRSSINSQHVKVMSDGLEDPSSSHEAFTPHGVFTSRAFLLAPR